MAARAGPGIYPFGHSDADQLLGQDVKQYLGLYIPVQYSHHNDVTSHRIRYHHVDASDRKILVAYLIFQDILREFCRYREMPLDSRPIRGGRSKSAKALEVRIRPFQIDARFDGAAIVVTNTVLYTSLLIPGRTRNEVRDQKLDQYWSGGLQPCLADDHDEKKGQEEFKQDLGEYVPSSLQMSSSDGTSASALLGDPSTRADSSVHQYSTKLFVGRLYEVVVTKDLGTNRTIRDYDTYEPKKIEYHIREDEKHVLDFDSWMRALIVENSYLYQTDSNRRELTDLVMGGGTPSAALMAKLKIVNANEEGAPADHRNAPQSNWTDIFGEGQVTPCEMITSVKDFLYCAQQIDPMVDWSKWEGDRQKTNVFSVFFGLEKQLNLIPANDVDSSFRLMASYHNEVNRSLVFGWPGLRRRYLTTNIIAENDLNWRANQRTCSPVPTDIISYDERRFQEWFKSKNFSYTPLTGPEAGIQLTQVLNDGVRTEEEDRILIMQRARAMFARDVGIGAHVSNISEAYLFMKNTEQKDKIQQKFERKIAALPQSDTVGRRREMVRMRVAIRQFQAQAAIEVARCIYHPDGATSDSIKATAIHIHKHLARNNNRLNIGFNMHASNLTIMGNFWTLLGHVFEVVFEFLYTHDMIVVLLASSWCSADPADGLRPNTLQEGEFSTSKSFGFMQLRHCLVEGAVDLITDKTANAETDNRSTDGGVEIFEEANENWFTHSKIKGGKGGNSELQQWKAKLTRNQVVKEYCWINKETGKRENMRSVHSCKKVYHFSTNSDTRRFDPNMLSRFLCFTILRRSRPGFAVSDYMTSRPNNDIRIIRNAVRERLTMIHALISATYVLEKCGVTSPVNTSVTNGILRRVRSLLEQHSNAPVPDRVTEMLMFMVRASTVARALSIRYTSPNSVFYQREFHSMADLLRSLVTLEPDLVDADPTICVHLMSMIESNFFTVKNRFEVIEALLAVCCNATPWTKSASGGGLTHLHLERHGFKSLTTLPTSSPSPSASSSLPSPSPSSSLASGPVVSLANLPQRKRKRYEDEKYEEDGDDGPRVEIIQVPKEKCTGPIVPKRPDEIKRHPITCFCDPCLAYRREWIDTHEMRQCEAAQQPNVDFVDHERALRRHRYTQNKLVRQYRYLSLSSILCDENGTPVVAAWKEMLIAGISHETQQPSQPPQSQPQQSPPPSAPRRRRSPSPRRHRHSSRSRSPRRRDGPSTTDNSNLDTADRKDDLDDDKDAQEPQELDAVTTNRTMIEDIFNDEFPRPSSLSRKEWYQNLIKMLDARIPKRAVGGMYYRINDIFPHNDDDDDHGGKEKEHTHTEILNKIASLIYNYMKINSLSTPSKFSIYKTLLDLSDTDHLAIPAEFPTKDDSGLGNPPPQQDKTPHNIKIITFFKDGGVGLSARLSINNVIEPLRAMVQDALEYEHTFPRSIPFSLYSLDCPQMYSVINSLPDPNKPFVTESVRQISQTVINTLQQSIFSFSGMPAMDTNGQRKAGESDDANSEFTSSSSGPSFAQAMRTERSQRLDCSLEDYEWRCHNARLGYSPQELLLLGSAPESVLCAWRLKQQQEFTHAAMQKDNSQDVWADASTVMYPECLIRDIRKQQETNAETRRLLHGRETQKIADLIPTSSEVAKDIFVNGEDLAITQWYNDMMKTPARPALVAPPPPPPQLPPRPPLLIEHHPTTRKRKHDPTEPRSSKRPTTSPLSIEEIGDTTSVISTDLIPPAPKNSSASRISSFSLAPLQSSRRN